MTEDELVLDMSMKKKKKKKKTGFDADAAMGEDAAPKEETADKTEEIDTTPVDTEQSAPDRSEEPILDDDFSNFTKKKKKKKKAFDLADMEEALPQKEEEPDVEGEVPEDEADAGTVPSMDDDLNLSLPSKKRKKKKVTIIDTDMDTTDAALDKNDDEAETPQDSSVWSQHSDKDYTYEELLGRVFDIMRDKNPEMISGEKKRFIMKPPQVMRAGAKKTSFSNFAEICKALHRMPKHLLQYLLSELGTSGSIDGSNQLIIKGRFQQKQIEHVLRRYIKEYVTCHTCRSPDTILQKDTRIYFLQCETCGSRCSVASIKSGFQAVTGRRAAIRARES